MQVPCELRQTFTNITFKSFSKPSAHFSIHRQERKTHLFQLVVLYTTLINIDRHGESRRVFLTISSLLQWASVYYDVCTTFYNWWWWYYYYYSSSGCLHGSLRSVAIVTRDADEIDSCLGKPFRGKVQRAMLCYTGVVMHRFRFLSADLCVVALTIYERCVLVCLNT